MSDNPYKSFGAIGGPLEPHRGALILILGLIGLLACQPFAIAAWTMGRSDLKKIRAGTMDPTGESITQVGWVLGIIGTILFALSLVAFVVGLVIMMILMATAATHVEILNQANEI
jgi:hypothetical protein